MATLLKADGTQQPIEERLTLRTMQRLVGGYIEFVTIGGSQRRREVLIVNEDGLRLQLPINPEATRLYHETHLTQHPIVGDAIRCVCVDGGLDTEAYE